MIWLAINIATFFKPIIKLLSMNVNLLSLIVDYSTMIHFLWLI